MDARRPLTDFSIERLLGSGGGGHVAPGGPMGPWGSRPPGGSCPTPGGPEMAGPGGQGPPPGPGETLFLGGPYREPLCACAADWCGFYCGVYARLGPEAAGARSPAPRQRTRMRTVFTETQSRELEQLFLRAHYPPADARAQLAACTGLSEETVRVWFKNRRARRKRQRSGSKPAGSRSPPRGEGGPNGT